MYLHPFISLKRDRGYHAATTVVLNGSSGLLFQMERDDLATKFPVNLVGHPS